MEERGGAAPGGVAGDLDEATLAPLLSGRLGHPLRVFSSVGSTNAEAATWAAAGAPEGALVVAEHQTAGRGRRGRAWISAPGKLIQFSVVLRPRLPASRAGLLGSALGVACAQGIADACRLPASLKWPNDVTVGGLKLAGVLVEARTARAGEVVAVCGAGINHGWRGQEMPPGIARRATSVAAAMDMRGLGPPPSRAEVLASVLGRLEGLLALLVDAPGELVARAAALSATVGRAVQVSWPDGRVMEGNAARLLPDGSLEVHDASGQATVVRAAEVEHLRAARRSS